MNTKPLLLGIILSLVPALFLSMFFRSFIPLLLFGPFVLFICGKALLSYIIQKKGKKDPNDKNAAKSGTILAATVVTKAMGWLSFFIVLLIIIFIIALISFLNSGILSF